MSPEESAQLRHLMRKQRQLPQPVEQLLRHATKRKSRASQLLKTSELPYKAVQDFKKKIK